VGTIIVPKESFSKYPRRRRRAETKEIVLNDKHINDDQDIMDAHKNSDKCSLKNCEKEKGFALKKSLSSCDVVGDKFRNERHKKCKSLHNHTIFLDSSNLPTETLNEEGNGEFSFLYIFLFFLLFY
jgi:hypothetical protein